MADLIAYTDLASYLNVTFSATEQTTATLCCAAASDAVRNSTNRTFEIQGAATDRYFTAKMVYDTALGVLAQWYPWPGQFPFTLFSASVPAPILTVDDYFLTGQTLGQITVTDKTTLTTYVPSYAYPYNADSKGNPFEALVFPVGTVLATAEGQIKVNAKWGYVTSIPATVKEAALLQAARYFKRKDAPFGIAGDPSMLNSMRLLAKLDPDVEAMLGNYRKWWAVAS